MIFTQNESSLKLINSFDQVSTMLSGDTRFDNVMQKALEVKADPIIEQFRGADRLLILGSVWIEDMEVLKASYKNFREHSKY